MSAMRMGWAGPAMADEAWRKIGHLFSTFQVYRTKERKGKHQLWRLVEKVGGKLNFTPQPDGDCVSAAARDVLDILQCTEIAKGDREVFKPIFSPYHYATGRVLIGKNRLQGGAGSLGSWQAEAIKKYGCVPYETPGLPAYNKQTTQAWGDDRKHPESLKSFRDFLDTGSQHPVQDTARLNSVEDIGDAVENGHPVTIAAQFGYQMKPDANGFHNPNYQDPWGHQMSIIEVDWDREFVIIKNQWGDVHGRLLDLDDGAPLPIGCMRVRFIHLKRHIAANSEIYAFSRFNGFPEQTFDFGSWA